MKLIRCAELEAKPWKNGGGITRELDSYPPEAGFDDFLWRASIADVNASGPFSSFPGIDRIIMLLDGDGMDLDFTEGRTHALRQRWMPFLFRGEETVHARMAGTPSRDFNFMVRRSMADADIHLCSAERRINCDMNGFLVLFCLAGCWRVELPHGECHEIGTQDALSGRLATKAIDAVPIEAGSVLAVINVRPLSRTGSSHDE